MKTAKYDGIAEWYDAEQQRIAQRDDAPLEQFADLVGPPDGVVVEIGCGTGTAAAALAQRGWEVGGVDLSLDQLRIAQPRCRWVVRADAHELPLRSRSLKTIGLCFVHTDVDAFDQVLREIARVLEPGGRVAGLGVHPCFVGHHIDSPTRSDSRLGIVNGYRDGTWVESSEQFGPGIRARVGARHVPLAEYVSAIIRAPLELESVAEFGDGIVPWMLGFTGRRR